MIESIPGEKKIAKKFWDRQRRYNKEAVFQSIMEILREKEMMSVSDLVKKTGIPQHSARRLIYKLQGETGAIRQVHGGSNVLEAIWMENRYEVVKVKVLSVEGNIVKFVDLKKQPIAKIEVKNPNNFPVGRIMDIHINY